MHTLLSFTPEPFEDPAEPQGAPERAVAFAEDEMEEEGSRRRPRARGVPARRGGRRPSVRPQAARVSGRFTLPGTLPRRRRRPPRRRPLLSFIPLAGPLFPPPQSDPAAAPSEYVRWVQSSLNMVEGLTLPIDGVMSPATRSAIR